MTTVALPLPPSVNNMFANSPRGGRFRTGAYKQWSNDAHLSVIAQARQPRMVHPPYRVEIALPAAMRGDVSNRVKALEDLMVRAGVMADDRHVATLIVRRAPDVKAGTCSISVATEANA